jgi:cell division protein FtsQ
MKKFYRIIILLTTFIFLTTYVPSDLNFLPKNEKVFFTIKDIRILNNNLIKKNEIIEKLNKIYGKNIILIRKEDIKKYLESIHFLEKIEVKKKYPDTIIIKIYETKPVAILFKKNSKYFLDNQSNLIPLKDQVFFDNLPTIIGEDGHHDFINFFNKLEKNNFPIKKIKNFYYFQIGRWDLQLSNGKTIKFPSDKVVKAINQSIKLLNRKDFESYNVIDLRIDGKVIVE